MSPSGIALRLSGKVHATSYIGSSWPFEMFVTRLNVQRRRGALDALSGRVADVAKGRGISAMAGTLEMALCCHKATSSTTNVGPTRGPTAVVTIAA